MKKIISIIVALCLLALCYGESYECADAAAVAAAAAVANPGDSIILAGKTTWTDQNIYLTAYGTEDKPIYLKGNGRKLTGLSKLHLGGRYIIAQDLNFAYGYSEGGLAVVEFRQKSTVLCEYCTIRRSFFTGINPDDLSEKYSWIVLYGKKNTFTNNTISYKKHMGPTLVSFQSSSVADYHVISYNNFISRPTYNNQENEQETIRLGDSSSQSNTYTTVEHNTFYEQNGEMEVVSSKSNRNVFRYNTFIRCKGTLTLRRADYNEVYGNQFIGDGVSNTGGIRVVWGKGHVIYNNYCENLGTPTTNEVDRACLAVGNGESSPGTDEYKRITDLTYVFNTARGCKQTMVLGSTRGTYAPSYSVIAHNIFESDKEFIFFRTTPNKINYFDNYLWGAGTQPENMTGFVYEDPKFKTDATYLLKSSTNAQKVTSGYDFLTDDISEYTRTSKATPGCYQVRV